MAGMSLAVRREPAQKDDAYTQKESEAGVEEQRPVTRLCESVSALFSQSSSNLGNLKTPDEYTE